MTTHFYHESSFFFAVYPGSFLRADDNILSIIEDRAIEDPSPTYSLLRQLLNERRMHTFYKQVAEVEIEDAGDKLWEMSEDEIKEGLLGCLEQPKPNGSMPDGKRLVLNDEDFIVEKRQLHFGRKHENPVLGMRFIEKAERIDLRWTPIDELPVAKEAKNLPMTTPASFIRQTIRIFCRSYEKFGLIQKACNSWQLHRMAELNIDKTDEKEGCYKTFSNQEVDDDETQPDSQPQLLTQQDEAEDNDILASPPLPRKRDSSDDDSVTPKPAKKRLYK